MSDEQGGLIYGMEELQAEVERLKAELLAAEVGMAVGIDLRNEAEAQRDALADALLETRDFLRSNIGVPDGYKIMRDIEAALRAAGRL